MKTLVDDLIGPALDEAVAKCEGGPVLAYSTDWAQGGPIINRERITIRHWDNETFVTAYMPVPGSLWYNAPTALIAAMRAFVASKLGDEYES